MMLNKIKCNPLRVVSFLLLLFFTFFSNSCSFATQGNTLAFRRAALLSRGTNMGGWLAIRATPVAPTKADLQTLKSYGITHIRLPFSPAYMFTNSNYTAVNEQHLAAMLNFVSLATHKYHMAVILDNHPDPNEMANALAKTTTIWDTLTPRLKQLPANVIFETYNEPDLNDTPSWTNFQNKVIAVIRKYDTTHTVMVDGMYIGWFTGLDPLKALPDSNVIYSVHYYTPMVFNYQGANWMHPYNELRGISYPTVPSQVAAQVSALPDYAKYAKDKELIKEMTIPYNENAILDDFAHPLRFAKRNNVPIYIGEIGAYTQRSSEADRNAWFKDTINVLSTNNIGYAFFNYWGADFHVDLPSVLNK